MPTVNGFTRATKAAIGLAEDALNSRQLAETFPENLGLRVLPRLKKSGCLVESPLSDGNDKGGAIGLDEIRLLITEMAFLVARRPGFTFAPIPAADGTFSIPTTGHCVALAGTNCPIEHTINAGGFTAPIPFNLEPLPLPEEEVRILVEWVLYMKPILDTKLVWLGGYRRIDGVFETEITTVFGSDRQNEAHQAAQEWKQYSYWTIDHTKRNGGSETVLKNTPPDSVFEALMNFRSLGR